MKKGIGILMLAAMVAAWFYFMIGGLGLAETIIVVAVIGAALAWILVAVYLIKGEVP